MSSETFSKDRWTDRTSRGIPRRIENKKNRGKFATFYSTKEIGVPTRDKNFSPGRARSPLLLSFRILFIPLVPDPECSPRAGPLLVYFHRLSSHHGATQTAAVRELLLFAGRRPARVAVLNDSKPVSMRSTRTHTYTHTRSSYLLLELDTPRSSATGQRMQPRHRKFWCRCSPMCVCMCVCVCVCVSIVSRSSSRKNFRSGRVAWQLAGTSSFSSSRFVASPLVPFCPLPRWPEEW